MPIFSSQYGLKSTLLFGLVALVLLGIGCNNDDKKSNRSNEAPSSTQFVQLTPEQEAYVYCTIQGYNIKIKLGSENKRKQIICEFPDGSSCDAILYLNEGCLPGENYSTEESFVLDPHDDSIFGARYCEPIAEPVCGRDGRTYTNECIALLSDATISHEGSCQSEEITQNGSTSPLNPAIEPTTGASSERSTDLGGGTPAAQPTWVNIPQAIVRQQTPGSHMSQCLVGGDTYYLVKSNCPECVTLIYSATGEITCYPEHDIGGKCPEEFVQGTPNCFAI